MKNQIFLSGHGGQGVLDLGNFLAYQYMLEGKHVVYTPSYGPETRGGKVRCYVITSEGEVDSPIAEEPDVMMIMNLPSMDFEPLLKSGGTFFYNTSLTEGKKPEREDITVVPVPATQIAADLDQVLDEEYLKTMKDLKKAQNCAMYGAYLAYIGKEEADLEAIFSYFYFGRKARFNKLNIAAVKAGMKYIHDHNLKT